jgi:universal stress protein E
MKPIRRILFAVRNPVERRQPGIVKAIAIARSFGASLEVFHALSSPMFGGRDPMTRGTLASLRQQAVERAREHLEKLSVLANRSGVTFSCAAEWDYPPHEAIVRRAAMFGADLIVAECHRGRRTQPWLMHLTDWELLRTSTLPVLLLKNARRYRRPVVLAAVDPLHAHDKPARLDADIMAAGAQFSVGLHGRLHVMHANNPPLGTLAISELATNPPAFSMAYEALEQQGRETFENFMQAMGIAPARQHLINRMPTVAIPALARSTRAALVVMGAVSRSGLSRVFIGNTAERVLDALPCDVLVIKPRGTKTRVAPAVRRTRALPQPAIPLVA